MLKKLINREIHRVMSHYEVSTAVARRMLIDKVQGMAFGLVFCVYISAFTTAFILLSLLARK